jgi:hypothetical protein
MTKGNFYNSDTRTLTWGSLTHPETLTTLRLKPGEVVENLFVPWGFSDPYLLPISVEPVGDQAPDNAPAIVSDPPVDPPPAEDSPAEPSEEG